MGRRSTYSSTVSLALLSLGAPAAAQKVPGTDLGVTDLVVVSVVTVVIVCALAFSWLFFCYHICKSRREYQRFKERIKKNAISERARRQHHQELLRRREGEGHSQLPEDGSRQPQSPARLGQSPISLSSLARSPSTDLPSLDPRQHSTPTHSGTTSPLHSHFPDTSGISETRAQTPGTNSDSRARFAVPSHRQYLPSHSHSGEALSFHNPLRPSAPPSHHLSSPSAPSGHQPPHIAMSSYHGQLRSVEEDEEIDVRPEEPPRYSRLYPSKQWGKSPTRSKDSMAEFSQLSSWPQFT